MPVSQTEESSAEIPRLFLVRLPREGGYNYVVCRGEVLFDDTNLPESVEGAVLEAFEHALLYLRNRIDLLLALPQQGIDELELHAIGKGPGASRMAADD